MFDSGWSLLILLAAGFAAYCVWKLATADQKRRARIEKQFGRAPQKNYRRAAIDRYWRALRERLPQQDIVDDVTWSDLDLEAVFDRIDTCQTSLGQDYLYAVLHQPLCGGACPCVAATHDTELTKLLADCYENYPFCEQIEADGVHFDYRLRTGLSVTRNAIKLLAAYGFPQAVVTQAETLARQMSGGATTLR